MPEVEKLIAVARGAESLKLGVVAMSQAANLDRALVAKALWTGTRSGELDTSDPDAGIALAWMGADQDFELTDFLSLFRSVCERRHQTGMPWMTAGLPMRLLLEDALERFDGAALLEAAPPAEDPLSEPYFFLLAKMKLIPWERAAWKRSAEQVASLLEHAGGEAVGLGRQLASDAAVLHESADRLLAAGLPPPSLARTAYQRRAFGLLWAMREANALTYPRLEELIAVSLKPVETASPEQRASLLAALSPGARDALLRGISLRGWWALAAQYPSPATLAEAARRILAALQRSSAGEDIERYLELAAQQLGPATSSVFRAVLEQATEGGRIALRALGATDEPGAVALLQELATGPAPRSGWAEEGIARHRRPWMVPWLQRVVGDAATCSLALAVLSRFAPNPARRALSRALTTSAADSQTRAELERLSAEPDLPELTQLLADSLELASSGWRERVHGIPAVRLTSFTATSGEMVIADPLELAQPAAAIEAAVRSARSFQAERGRWTLYERRASGEPEPLEVIASFGERTAGEAEQASLAAPVVWELAFEGARVALLDAAASRTAELVEHLERDRSAFHTEAGTVIGLTGDGRAEVVTDASPGHAGTVFAIRFR